MPARMDIPLQRNEDYGATWILTRDDLGDPIDLTGCALRLQIKSKLTDAVIASAQIDLTDPTNGRCEVLIKASGSAPLRSYGNVYQTVNLPYDATLTDPQGLSVALVAGNIVLSRGVSQP